MPTTVGEIARRFEGQVRGDAQLAIAAAGSFDAAGSDQITFLAEEKYVRRLPECAAGAVLLSEAHAGQIREGTAHPTLIVVGDPVLAFVTLLQEFRPQRPRPSLGISPDARISPSATIGANTNIWPGAFVDDDVVIGQNCDIHPGVCIAAGCRIGDSVTLYPNVVLYPGAVIGNRVIIHASAVIGADGFGYRFADGRFHKLPHLGDVRIEDDVEIGACATVDRAMIGATVVGQGSKIDNLVMIAHNCRIGAHNAFASQSGMAGSVTTGDYVRLGGQAGIRDHVHLGTGSSLGARAGVHKDIPAGETWHGTPAGPVDEQMRIAMSLPKVPEMRKKVRDLEAQVKALQEQVAALAAARSQP